MVTLIEIDETGNLEINFPELIRWAFSGINLKQGNRVAALRTLEGKLMSIRTDLLGDKP